MLQYLWRDKAWTHGVVSHSQTIYAPAAYRCPNYKRRDIDKRAGAYMVWLRETIHGGHAHNHIGEHLL